MIIFGGSGGTYHSTFWNDLYKLDINTLAWSEVTECSGDIPCPRYGHTTTFLSKLGKQGSILLFGGKAAGGKYLNETHVLDLGRGIKLPKFSSSSSASYRWTKLNRSESVPSPRYYHSAVKLEEDKILIFGGKDTINGECNDLWLLSLTGSSSHFIHLLNTFTDRTWIPIIVIGKKPHRRYQHVMQILGENLIGIYGGISQMKILRDLWILNLSSSGREKDQIKIFSTTFPRNFLGTQRHFPLEISVSSR